MDCLSGLLGRSWLPSKAAPEMPASPVSVELIAKLVHEVVEREVLNVRESLVQNLRGFEVQLRALPVETEQSKFAYFSDVEALQQRLVKTERMRRRRSVEASALRMALQEVRSALVIEGVNDTTREGIEDIDECKEQTAKEAPTVLAKEVPAVLAEVRSERERWVAERAELEEQISALEQQCEKGEMLPVQDDEKEKLKISLKQLKTSIESRDRYGCWICNQLASQKRAYSDDDSESEGEVAKRDDGSNDSDDVDECAEMRKQIVEMNQEFHKLMRELQPDTALHFSEELSLASPDAFQSDEVKGQPRSMRGRVATPHVSKTGLMSMPHNFQLDESDSVPFSGTMSSGTFAMDGNQLPRSSQEQIPIPLVTPESLMNISTVTSARSSDAADIVSLGNFPDAMHIAHVSTEEGAPIMRCHDRIATGTLAGATLRPGVESLISVRFQDDVSVDIERVEVESQMPMKSTRSRIATPYTSANALMYEASTVPSLPQRKGAKFLDNVIVDVHETVSEGPMRSARNRIATPYLSADALMHENATVPSMELHPVAPRGSVEFSDSVSVAVHEVSSEQPMRRCRERMATPFVSGGTILQHDTLPATPYVSVDAHLPVSASMSDNAEPSAHTVQRHKRSTHSSKAVTVEAGATISSCSSKPARERVPTPHISGSALLYHSPKVGLMLPAEDPQQGVRFLGSVSMETSETGSVLPMRSSRDRVATPYIAGDALLVQGQMPPRVAADARPDTQIVRFAETVSTEVAENASDAPMRSTRGRIATPFVSGEAFAAPPPGREVGPRAVQFLPEVSTHVCEACPTRRTRERIATPFTWENLQAGDSRPMRSLRDRVATPFLTADPINMHHGSQDPCSPVSAGGGGVQLDQGANVIQRTTAAIDLRPVRGRVPTGFVHSEGVAAEGQAVEGVRFAEGEDVVHGGIIAPGAKPVRCRVATGFVPAGLDADAGSGVRFAEAEDVVETSSASSLQGMRSVRDRVATGFAGKDGPMEDVGVRFSEVPDVREAVETSPTGGSEEPSRVYRSETCSTASGSERSLRFDDAPGVLDTEALEEELSDADTVESPSGTSTPTDRKRHSRMSTPHISASRLGFGTDPACGSEGGSEVSGDLSEALSLDSPKVPGGVLRGRKKSQIPDFPLCSGNSGSNLGKHSLTQGSSKDRESIKKASFNVHAEREIWKRVRCSFIRKAQQDRIDNQNRRCLDHEYLGRVPAPKRYDSMTYEQDLQKHCVTDVVKDRALIGSTLRALDFFEDLSEDSLSALVDVMEVFEFNDGDDVVRQGDSDGTHFFVVMEGEFIVLRDGVLQASLQRGTSFGESVLLLFGERSATVRARGRARAYGMQGIAVREALRLSYKPKHEVVISAVDDTIASQGCRMLWRLNGYQLQSLYELSITQNFAEGEVLYHEGSTTVDQLHIVLTGEFVLQVGGAEVGRRNNFGIVGDMALAFGHSPYTVTAAVPTSTLTLSRDLLVHVLEEDLPQVLVRNRILTVLSKHKILARLSPEQSEALAAHCKIHSLPAGQELESADVRLVVCLSGEVQARRDDGAGGEIRSYTSAMDDSCCIGVEFLPSAERPWCIRVRASDSARPALLGVWKSEDLDNTREFDDFNLSLENEDKMRVLTTVFLFRTLAPQQLRRLASSMAIEYVRFGQRIFSKGDIGTEFYIIRKGLVLVEIGGKKIRTLGRGDYFGERALLNVEPRSADISVVEEVELWKMDKETFNDIMKGGIVQYMQQRMALQDTKLSFEDLQVLRVIGRGGFGVVKMVRARHTGTRYALKCVEKRGVVEKGQQEALVCERAVLAEVDHPFIIKFVRSFKSPTHVYLLMELVSGGELLDALDSLGLLMPSQARFYTGSLVLALEFLHDRRIAYLDLKSENCLIDHQGYLKLIDFGIAQRITRGCCHTVKGTPLFMAPEMILGKGYSTFADLWSLGICAYEFVIGEFPFAKNCTNHAEIFREVLKAPLKFPVWFQRQAESDKAMSLIRGLLDRDPQKRPGAGFEGYSALRNHSFFQGFSWDDLLGRNDKECRPPFVPKCETYAEDKDIELARTSGQATQPPIEEQESAEDGSTTQWVDPAPGWDVDF